MRFPAATEPKQPLRNAAELPRRPTAKQPLPHPQPAPARPEELPAALDERVRLLGEW